MRPEVIRCPNCHKVLEKFYNQRIGGWSWRERA